MGVVSSTCTTANDLDDNMRDLPLLPQTQWIHDSRHQICMLQNCNNNFSLSQRKHHCRYCARIVCNNCSRGRYKSYRICDECYDFASNPINIIQPNPNPANVNTDQQNVQETNRNNELVNAMDVNEKYDDYKQTMLMQLCRELTMGTRDECIIALQQTKYKGIDEAVEWLINQSPSKVMENEAISECKLDETKHCNCYKRLLSMMDEYNQWIDKQQLSTNMNDEFLKLLNELNNNSNYSICQILNDYFHIKNNHNNDLQSISCKGTNCFLLCRNMRNRE
eukprot:392875_1